MSRPKKQYISTTTLTLMTIASVLGLRGFPMMAEEGIFLFAYLAFSAFLFLLPAALVSAELGSTFTKEGAGVYTWVKEAFGSRCGTIAIWMQWSQNIIWYPVILGFASANLAYLFDHPELAKSGTYTGAVILIIYWASIFIELNGEKLVQIISKYSIIFGMLIPAGLLIVFALYWINHGNPIEFLETAKTDMVMDKQNNPHIRFFPHMHGLGSVAFLAGILMFFTGIEIQAAQVNKLKNPAKEFPFAMIITTFIAVIISILGSLSIATIVPHNDISLTAAVMQAFDIFCTKYDLQFLIPILSVCIVMGVISAILSWLEGPSRALLATAKDGEIPPILAKTNKKGAPISILMLQATLVTSSTSLYFLMDDVSVAFFMLSAMSATLYIIVYLLMFATVIKLRHSKPDLARGFKIPGGMFGVIGIAGTGFLSVAFAFIVAFFPPTQLPIGNPMLYIALVTIGTFAFLAIPLGISLCKRESWKNIE